MTKKLKRALKLYPFYEAASGDLLFFSVVQTLFLTQVKGFSAAQIATIILFTDLADLALEYPSYRAIRRLGNSRACVIGGIMPLIGIVLITLGRSLPLVAAGMVFFVSAGNFQSMAGAAARNNLVLLGEKEKYAKLFSKGNTLYASVSMVSSAAIPFLFSVNRYIPSFLCITTCALIAALSFLIADCSEHGGKLPPSKEQKEPLGRIGKGLRLLLVFFCLFFCSGAVFTSNTEVFLSGMLGEICTEQMTIMIYGAIVWAARLTRLCSNILLEKILEKLKERIVPLSSAAMLFAFAAIGISGLFFRGTIIPIVLAALAYVIIKGVLWDPLRTFLRMTAVDTNSKKKQQTMLVYLNAGQSVVSILMDLLVVGVLKIFAIEYVFLAFAVIGAFTAVCAARLRRALQQSAEIVRYETVLNEASVDRISQIVYEKLTEAGLQTKEALSYRLLAEEKLMECIKEGKTDSSVCLSLVSKLDDIHVRLQVGGEEEDVFMYPKDADVVSQMIFHGILRGM